MCEYCEMGLGMQATNPSECICMHIVRPNWEPAEIMGFASNSYTLSVFTNDAAGYWGEGGEIYYEIDFCPKCGRKLS